MYCGAFIIIIIIKGIYIAQVRKGHKCFVLQTSMYRCAQTLYEPVMLYERTVPCLY